jgi:hypothetical protein
MEPPVRKKRVFPEASLLRQTISFDRGVLEKLQGRQGRVHSIFQKALAMEVDGALVSLVPGSRGEGPGFVLVPESSLPFHRWGLDAGTGVSLSPEAILIGGGMAISLKDAAPFDSLAAFPPLPSSPPGQVEENVLFTGEYLSRCAGCLPVPGLYGPGLFPRQAPCPQAEYVAGAVAGFLLALSSGSLPALEAALDRLVGLGGGLTPFCDDLLGGFIAASLYHRHFLPRPGQIKALELIRQELPRQVSLRLEKTGFISRAFLGYALQGRLTGCLQSLLSCFFTGDIKKNRPLLDSVRDFGDSSGVAVITGILAFFLAARQGHPPTPGE